MAGPPQPEEEIRRLQKENERLHRAVHELSILNDIATAVSSTLSLERILDLMLRKCLQAMGLEQGAVLLLEQGEEKNPFRTMVRRGDSRMHGLPFRLDTQLAGWMLRHQQPLRVDDLAADPRFQPSPDDAAAIRSLLAVPLTVKGRMIGLLAVFNKQGGQAFTDEEQRLLAIIATQSAQAIENSRLLEEEKTLQRVQEELRLAYSIQTGLLPAAAPRVPGFDIAGRSVPAREVGGDYYDFIHLEDDRLGICLADISGKGLPAALLMSNLQATMRSQARLSASARECVTRINTLLFHSTAPENFATGFYAILDPRTRRLECCNAGHNYPLLARPDGSHAWLSAGGLILGFLETYPYADETVQFQPGDTLLIFSDGLSEAANAAGEEFGESRLEELVKEHWVRPAVELVDALLAAVTAHQSGTPQTDDVTIVVIKAIE